jgi:hypothetical protein
LDLRPMLVRQLAHRLEFQLVLMAGEANKAAKQNEPRNAQRCEAATEVITAEYAEYAERKGARSGVPVFRGSFLL